MAEDLYHRYEFTFIVQMLTVSQEQAIEESLGGRVEDRRGLQLLTLTSEGMRAATTAITVVDQLVAAGVRPQRTHPDLVSRQDIADRAGGDAASCRAVGARGPAGGYAFPDSVQLGCRGDLVLGRCPGLVAPSGVQPGHRFALPDAG